MANQHGGTRVGAGRPPQGKTSKVVRVPADMDIEIAIYLYYDLYAQLKDLKKTTPSTPRYYWLRRLLDNLLYL